MSLRPVFTDRGSNINIYKRIIYLTILYRFQETITVYKNNLQYIHTSIQIVHRKTYTAMKKKDLLHHANKSV